MDALALLCNLHADGPATLQRLRRASCDSLTALRRLDPASLAELLDWNERAAERFLREAALLCERVQEDDTVTRENEPAFELAAALEEGPAEGPAAGSAEGTEEADSDDEYEGEEGDGDEEAEDEALESIQVLTAERAEAVLGEWRELDRVAPPADPAEFVIPRPAPPPDRALDEIALDGLTPALRGRLATLGVSTLRHLVDARELELSRALPLGFTRLKRLQFQAARALEDLPASASAEAAAPGFEPFEPPPCEPFEVAGPFGSPGEPFETAGPFA